MPDALRVERCPICEGRGVVGYPPNIPATQREFVSSSTGPWPCPYCKGAMVDMARSLAASQQEVERLKGKLELADTFADAQLTDIGRLRTQLAAAREENERLREALRTVALGEGRFSRDPLTHAENCINAMVSVATAALTYELDTARSTDAERTHGETR